MKQYLNIRWVMVLVVFMTFMLLLHVFYGQNGSVEAESHFEETRCLTSINIDCEETCEETCEERIREYLDTQREVNEKNEPIMDNYEASKINEEEIKRMSTNKKGELDFWRGWIKEEGAQWRPDFLKRTTESESIFQLAKYYDENEYKGKTFHLLDVGCGPFSWVGHKWPNPEANIEINFMACDPLALSYGILYDEFKLEPLHGRPSVCFGEMLDSFYLPKSFDLLYSRNALDHGMSPILSIKNMLGLVKKGKFVILDFHENVGKLNFYKHAHKWDFWVEKGTLMMKHELGEPTDVGKHKLLEGKGRIFWAGADGQETDPNKVVRAVFQVL